MYLFLNSLAVSDEYISESTDQSPGNEYRVYLFLISYITRLGMTIGALGTYF